MGWFDEQLKQRKEINDRDLEEALYRISDSVTGKNYARFLESDWEKASGTLQEIILMLGGTIIDGSEKFTDFNDEMEYLCRPNGIMNREVVLEKNWHLNSIGSFIATNNETGEIVALNMNRVSGRYRYLDSETGKWVSVTKKTAGLFEGSAICFYKPLPLRKLKAKDLFKYGMSVWTVKDIALPVILLLAMSLMGLLIPKLNHFLFGEVYEMKNVNFLAATVIFLVCISVSTLLADTVHTYVVYRNETKTNISVEAAVMMRIFSLPPDFFRKYSSGEIMQRVNYANTVCSFFIELFFCTGLTSVLSLIYISQMVLYGGSLAVVAVIIIILTILFSLITTLIGIKNAKQVMETGAKEFGVAYSLIRGIQKIKVAGAEKRAFARWAGTYSENSKVSYNPPAILKIRNVIPIGISLFGTLVIYIGAVNNSLSVADFFAFETAFAMVMGAFNTLVSITESAALLKPTIEMIAPILDEEPEVSEGKQIVTKLSGRIELNNVSFRYSDSMPPVFENLSMKIKEGEYVGIVGKTGCGKSTLIRLLLGFEKPKRGAIYFDGKDMTGIDLASLRRNIGTVLQDGKLFQGDIYSNIIVSAPWLTVDDAWEAAETAYIADDIRKMPMGMNTMISEGSGGISGGQKQRLMIARAIVGKPKILILDEATSALDNVTQKAISDSLDSLECTRIIIAHRLSTIRNCDRILVVDRGKIAEQGTYDELLKQNGIFADLVNRQRL